MEESAEEYMTRNHVLTYLEDALAQLLDHKDENPKVVASRFFCEYFTLVKEGKHVLFRNYQYIRATPHNRTSFLSMFVKSFRHLGKRGELITVDEYGALIQLLCLDFSLPLVQKTNVIILMEDALECVVSFQDFIYAFQIQFYYDEFLTKTEEVYRTLLCSPPKDTVVVPTSESPASHEERLESPGDTVDSMHLYKLLCPIVEKACFSCPSLAAIHRLLASSTRVSYYGFLNAMAKSEEISQEIGVLPRRDELYDGLEEKDYTTLLENASSSTSSTTAATAVTKAEGKDEDAPKKLTVKKTAKKTVKRKSPKTPTDDDSSSDSSND